MNDIYQQRVPAHKIQARYAELVPVVRNDALFHIPAEYHAAEVQQNPREDPEKVRRGKPVGRKPGDKVRTSRRRPNRFRYSGSNWYLDVKITKTTNRNRYTARLTRSNKKSQYLWQTA